MRKKILNFVKRGVQTLIFDQNYEKQLCNVSFYSITQFLEILTHCAQHHTQNRTAIMHPLCGSEYLFTTFWHHPHDIIIHSK